MNTPVSFEIAKLLKDKGFDEITNYNYSEVYGYIENINGLKHSDGNNRFVSAPTIAEVVMWLYEKHGIFIQLFPAGENKEWRFYSKIIVNDNGWIKIQHQISKFVNTPTEAYEAAIEYTLKNLITNN